jgi:2-octaprenyl-6-methoxyphenol hydroxylase
MNSYDIALIGGGLAGLSLAILLGQQGWKTVCIDREKIETQSSQTYDIRTTAISWGSRNLLKNAGIWDDIAPKSERISNILIRDEDSPVNLEFNAVDIQAEGFGWIVDNRDLRLTLLKHIQSFDKITHITGQSVMGFEHNTDSVNVILADKSVITTKLVIGADGRQSFTRATMGIKTWSRDYKQTAIVCLVNHTKPHNGLALEHFRSQGPFAVLPYTNDLNGQPRSAVVWTVEGKDANKWMQCDNQIFNTALQERCGDIYGDVSIIGNRGAWPFNLVKAKSYIGQRMVLVAESAHGMHPIAGQGLNMSLRDIAAITQLLKDVKDPGNPEILKKYQSMRRGDNFGMVMATNTLNDLFGMDFFAVRAARRFGLHAVSKLPFAKNFFMRQAMGSVGHLPDLIKEAKAI